jgi:inositol transport system substrate-binding protein
MKTGKLSKAVIIAMALIVLLTGAVFAKGGSESGGGKVFRVGYANSSDSDFFKKLVVDEVAARVRPDKNFEIVFVNADQDLQKQFDQFDTFIAQKFDAIIVEPVDQAGIAPAIQKANAARIPVISIVSRSSGGDFTYIGNTYIDGGIMQGEYMVKALPRNAKIVYMIGQLGYDHSRDRRAGFLDLLKKERPDVTLLAEQTANYDRAEGMKLMEDWIQAFPQIDGVICANDQMALGAIQALRAANRLSGTLIAGVDAVDEALRCVKNGEMAITILQSAPLEAQAAYDALKRLHAGETLPKEIIIPQIAITKDNINEYLK